MGRQVFTAGEILTAANMNDLSDQTVMVFDDATARATAIPTPVEGMLTYLESVGGPGGLEVFDGTDFVTASPPITREALPAGSILQVVSTTKTDTFTSTSTTPVAVTGATVTITPTSTNSKVFVSFGFPAGTSVASEDLGVQLLRGATLIGGGAAAGSRNQTITTVNLNGATTRSQVYGQFLDSPSTTSATTYSISVMGQGGNYFIGRASGDADSTSQVNNRTSLTITAMEVAG